MGYNVTSNFIEQLDSKSPDLIRKFTIAGSDYSSRVTKWPTFDKTWDDIRPKTLAMKLANGDQGMNFLREDKTLMENNCEVILGVEEKIDDPFNFTLLDRDLDHVYIGSEELDQQTIRINNNGTKLYILGQTSEDLHQYTMSTPYVLSSATYDSIFYDLSVSYDLVTDLIFKSDGTSFFILEWNNSAIREFTIATAWDLSSTIAEVTGQLDVSGEMTITRGMASRPNGSKFYAMSHTSPNIIYQYGLSTSWDVTTGSYDTASFTVGSENPDPKSFYFSSDGLKLYIFGATSIVTEYDLGTAWLLSSATYNSVTRDISTIVPEGRSFHFSDDGMHMYAVSYGINEAIQLQMSTAWDFDTVIINVDDYQITNTLNYDPIDITSSDDGTIVILLNKSTVFFRYNLSTPYSMSTATQDASSFNVSGEESAPRGAFVSDDGLHIYVVGYSAGSKVNEYSLSSAWNLSSPSFIGSYSISETASPTDLCFSSDGLKMYISDSGTLYQYTLSTAWLASSAAYDAVSLYVQPISTVVTSIVFKKDGTSFYVFSALKRLFEWRLSTPWDISDVTYISESTGFESILAYGIKDIAIRDDGSEIYAISDYAAGGVVSILNLLMPKSPADQIVLFSGKTKKLAYARENLTMTLVDKFQQLSDRKVGVNDVPVSYVGSNYLPSDVAWWIATSYGGFSDITSTSNPDIDYEDFQTWAAVFSGDSIFIEAEFDGQKCTEIMRKLSKITNSAIFIKENKISFKRFGIADAAASSLHDGNIRNLSLSFDSSKMVNKQFVAGDYDPDSGHLFNVFDESTASVNSFGLKENLYKDESVWYPSSGSAINLAQRLILSGTEEEDDINIETNLNGAIRLIGETVHVTDDFHSINGPYRIIGHKIDMDKGRTDLKVDRSQFSVPFILDVSTLDSTLEVLT